MKQEQPTIYLHLKTAEVVLVIIASMLWLGYMARIAYMSKYPDKIIDLYHVTILTDQARVGDAVYYQVGLYKYVDLTATVTRKLVNVTDPSLIIDISERLAGTAAVGPSTTTPYFIVPDRTPTGKYKLLFVANYPKANSYQEEKKYVKESSNVLEVVAGTHSDNCN
jgi:hypothetical protein